MYLDDDKIWRSSGIKPAHKHVNEVNKPFIGCAATQRAEAAAAEAAAARDDDLTTNNQPPCDRRVAAPLGDTSQLLVIHACDHITNLFNYFIISQRPANAH